ncbi:MAG: response regulator [Saprospiraceae bacterium]|uniref:Response regulator n=1 Tax=Candidatus Opimibacter skivensis TaxID=2982028 RepID=A0A9D7XMD8_9BACT|nr:response regulator [Candidatus Opimibacter skivensis]
MKKNKIHILLADDDNDDCRLFQEALNDLPVETELITVPNGEQLMELLSKKRKRLPDVLFLDLNMPRKNGFSSLGEIKRNTDLDQLPVIIFSTATEEEKVKQVYRDAAHYYIRKPATFSELKNVILKVLTLIRDKNMPLPTKENFELTAD